MKNALTAMVITGLGLSIGLSGCEQKSVRTTEPPEELKSTALTVRLQEIDADSEDQDEDDAGTEPDQPAAVPTTTPRTEQDSDDEAGNAAGEDDDANSEGLDEDAYDDSDDPYLEDSADEIE